MSDEVSDEEAREIESRHGYRSDGTSRTVTRLARTVIALRERHAAEVAKARREGAEGMKASVQSLLRARRREADGDEDEEYGDEDEEYAFQVVGDLIEAIADIPLPGEEVSRG